jgi:AraC-like DNA-binding protein
MRRKEIKCPGITIGPFEARVPIIGRTCAEPGEFITPHKHQMYELHFVKEGEIKIRIGRKLFHVRKNHIYIIRPGDIHYQHFIRRTITYYMCLTISQWTPNRNNRAAGASIENPRSGMHASINPIMRLMTCGSRAMETDEPIRKHLDLLFTKAIRGTFINLKLFTSEFSGFLGLFSNLLSNKNAYVSLKIKLRPHSLERESKEKIKRAILHIQSCFAQDLSMPLLARKNCLSQRHFNRLFKLGTGYTPSEFLLEQRLQKAIRLLRETDQKIDIVMRTAGFRNKTNFYRYFTRRTGLSPYYFRRNSRIRRNLTPYFLQ